jgi:hypothetical protein
MNANGLYNGLEGYIVPGTNSGMGNGVANGLVNNERKQIDKLNILDQYPGAKVAYSLRKLTKTYSGPAIRVRRSSDNTEQDIYFDLKGSINEIALLTFVGSESGFVSIWYDQSGSGNHASQSNTSLQPIIVSSGVINKQDGIACMNLSGIRWLQTSNAIFAPVDVFSIIFAAGTPASAASIDYFGTRTLNSGFLYGIRSTTNYILANLGLTNNTIAIGTVLTKHIAYASVIGSTNTLVINSNFSSTITTPPNFNSNPFYIGTGGNGGSLNYNSGNIFELIGYGNNQSINRLRMEQNLNQYYKIY